MTGNGALPDGRAFFLACSTRLIWNKTPRRNLMMDGAVSRVMKRGVGIMRKTQLALLTLSATVLAGFVTVTPAAARDYPWCAQGGEYDYPGECAYSTYEQCLASVSGRLLYCGANPRVGYGQELQPQPRSRHRTRHVAPY
jgi:hypothetical protein